jgi:hypothetical protein
LKFDLNFFARALHVERRSLGTGSQSIVHLIYCFELLLSDKMAEASLQVCAGAATPPKDVALRFEVNRTFADNCGSGPSARAFEGF